MTRGVWPRALCPGCHLQGTLEKGGIGMLMGTRSLGQPTSRKGAPKGDRLHPSAEAAARGPRMAWAEERGRGRVKAVPALPSRNCNTAGGLTWAPKYRFPQKGGACKFSTEIQFLAHVYSHSCRKACSPHAGKAVKVTRAHHGVRTACAV